MASEMGKLVDTIFAIPGMSTKAKVDLRNLTLKQVLVLCQLIERGIANDGSTSVLLGSLTDSEVEELKLFADEMLEKTGLADLNEKLNSINGK